MNPLTKKLECYWCGEDVAVFCKICDKNLCNTCHRESERTWFESDWLSPHQYYESEFLGVITSRGNGN